MKNAIYDAADRVMNSGLRLAEERYKRRVEMAQSAFHETFGKDMPSNVKATLALTLDNTFSYMKEQKFIPWNAPLREDVFSSNVDSFVNFGFDIITALLPSLILDEIASIQPMDRKVGEVFFLDFIRGTEKAPFALGSNVSNAQSGPGFTDGSYSLPEVNGETVATGAGATGPFAFSIFGFTVPGSVIITATKAGPLTMTVTDDGAGNLIGDLGAGPNTINYTTGAVVITNFAFAVLAATPVLATYRVDQERNPDSIGIVDLDIRRETVTAETRKLRIRWMMDAAYDLLQAHGREAAEELLAATISEIKREIEVDFMDTIYAAAGIGARTFDATVPQIGVSQEAHWKSILSVIRAASNDIFQATRRAGGNFIICGTGAATVVESIPEFKSQVDYMNPPAGPHVSGILQGRWKVIKNPDWPQGRMLVGHRGDNYFQAGAIWAPYRPVVATQPVTLDDFKTRRGVMSVSAIKVNYPDMFAPVTVINTP